MQTTVLPRTSEYHILWQGFGDSILKSNNILASLHPSLHLVIVSGFPGDFETTLEFSRHVPLDFSLLSGLMDLTLDCVVDDPWFAFYGGEVDGVLDAVGFVHGRFAPFFPSFGMGPTISAPAKIG